ncbi:hypothetical protein Tco_1528509 [Tanacetum coccineum]
MEKKDTLSSCSESEEQQMQLIQDKSKESCMVSFQRLHSHLKRLSNNDLKGSRTENGFGRAFATLFGQDFESFTSMMFLNMDQLQKQLDNNQFLFHFTIPPNLVFKGTIAYKLELPQELSIVRNTFHVSNLKKCYSDEPLAVLLEGLHVDDKLRFVEELVEIMDREVKRLKQSRILIVKVRWN